MRPWNLETKIKLLNCARCRRVLLGESMMDAVVLGRYRYYPFVRGFLPYPVNKRGPAPGHKRPFCSACFEIVSRR